MELVNQPLSSEHEENLTLHQELDLPSIQISRKLSLIGYCLLLIYLVFIVRSALPLQILNIVWQIQLSNSVVEFAPISVLGIVLLALSAYLDQGNEDLIRVQSLVARLSLIVSLGFILLIPLRAYHIFAFQQTIGNVQERQISQGLTRVKKIKDALNQASSREDLEARLKALSAPPLPQVLRQRSLSQLKEGLMRSLNQVESKFQQSKPVASKEKEVGSYLSNAKMMIISLLYAAIFAASGQRSNSDENFLDEILLAFRSLFVKVEPEANTGLDYLDMLSDQNESQDPK